MLPLLSRAPGSRVSTNCGRKAWRKHGANLQALCSYSCGVFPTASQPFPAPMAPPNTPHLTLQLKQLHAHALVLALMTTEEGSCASREELCLKQSRGPAPQAHLQPVQNLLLRQPHQIGSLPPQVLRNHLHARTCKPMQAWSSGIPLPW